MDGARRPRTFLKTEPGSLEHFVGRSQAASDVFEAGARRPRTFLRTEPGGLGRFEDAALKT